MLSNVKSTQQRYLLNAPQDYRHNLFTLLTDTAIAQHPSLITASALASA
ncbi:hypothetical protein [Nostoc sp. CCY 9925]